MVNQKDKKDRRSLESLRDATLSQREIEASAKKIMNSFMKALKKVGETETDFIVKREMNVREGEKSPTDPEFRDRMFKNAPKVKDECILAEKKKW